MGTRSQQHLLMPVPVFGLIGHSLSSGRAVPVSLAAVNHFLLSLLPQSLLALPRVGEM